MACCILTSKNIIPTLVLALWPLLTSFTAFLKTCKSQIHTLYLICWFTGSTKRLFWEEISACAAVHTRYVMGACNRARAIILLSPMMGTSFVLLALARLIVSKPKHRVTWSHRTCVNFPFLRVERIQYFSVSS